MVALFYLVAKLVIAYWNGNFFVFTKDVSKFLIRLGTIKLFSDLIAFQLLVFFSPWNEVKRGWGMTDTDFIWLYVFEIVFAFFPLLIGLVLKIISIQLIGTSINLKTGRYIFALKNGIKTHYEIKKIDSGTTNVHLVDYQNKEELIVLPYHIVIQHIKLGIFNYDDIWD
jgi:hypothetical protein